MFQVSSLKSLAPAIFVALVFCGGHQRTARADGPVVIDITDPQRSLYPVAIPLAVDSDPNLAKQVQSVASFDLKVAGWFKVLDPKSFLASLGKEKLSIDPVDWRNVGAFGVVKYRAQALGGGRIQLEFRLYEVEKGAVAVLSKSYRGDLHDVRGFTHQWCNEVVKYFTGEDGFFGSQIAFVTGGRKRTKRILAMDFDGFNVHSVTRNRYINILPAFSPDGSKIAFTSYMRKNPDLYVTSAGGGRARRISGHRGMNTGAAWSPDGSKIAATLSKDGNPEIYLLDARTGSILKRLTNSRYIETGPAFSPDGKKIAFVSDRQGGPQVFVMNLDGSGQHRVSMNGSYNTEPTWSPRPGTRILAYTTRAKGHFDIVTLDLASGAMVRITQNAGTNETPSFSPNGRAIAFASRRPEGDGVYIANADGTGDPVRVWSGNGTSIDWGPAPK
ncbi:MAG TPA: Tol-Pal system beta propeller repeat protein TolB [Kofleriaceae bacterium]|nr:Tol-Pal system beta propeller repeat protein TolB [Kofleriaceae bacterium]